MDETGTPEGMAVATGAATAADSMAGVLILGHACLDCRMLVLPTFVPHVAEDVAVLMQA